ncbi:protein FAM3C-like [Dunckerocampus dactyliophorus]|uniref:protein FAM3C-like n=1 Tax=Dunckerocampus dactyliophorus TaxID=161453 RepID=UPI002405428D|nr:protein FAM3C-like [Dunckerocampus dactyliophorus]
MWILILVPAGFFISVILLKLSNTSTADLTHVFWSRQSKSTPKPSAGSCVSKTRCPQDHFSFYMQSGAANVVPPKICVQSKLVLGTVLNNAGLGINVVILNGKTGAVVQSDHFNMYSEDDKSLIDFLKNIQQGSAVLMASYDDPSTRLTDEAKKLIGELGSSAVQSLAFRDNWVFVGGKGVVTSNLEKLLKNDKEKNKYNNWPELIELEGCIPKYLG